MASKARLPQDQVDGIMHPFVSMAQAARAMPVSGTFMMGVEMGMCVLAARPEHAPLLVQVFEQWAENPPDVQGFTDDCVTAVLEEIDPWLKT